MHVDQFLSELGVQQFADAQSFWDFLGTEEHKELRQSLIGMVSTRVRGEFSSADGDLLVASPAIVRLVHNAFAPHIESLLRCWGNSMLPSGDVLDLGCGAGVATCFYAMTRPDVAVVGVDESAVAIDTARQLAQELGIKNVTFICSDIASVDLGKTFSVVCSSSVWAEMERGTSRFATYFSALNEMRERLSSSHSDLAACAARHLGPHGVYVSFERCHDIASLAQWVGAQKTAGLWVDLAQSATVVVNGIMTGEEVMPRLIASAEPTVINEDALLAWRQSAASPSAELATELRIHKGVNWSVVQGFEVSIADQHGGATAQLFLLQHADDAIVYFRTNRGARDILGESSRGAQDLQRLFVEVLNQLLAHPHVLHSQPLTMIP